MITSSVLLMIMNVFGSAKIVTAQVVAVFDSDDKFIAQTANRNAFECEVRSYCSQLDDGASVSFVGNPETSDVVIIGSSTCELDECDQIGVTIQQLRQNLELLNSGILPGPVRAPVTVIKATVTNDFNGWNSRDTVVVLSNGQVWQQDEYEYDYHYAYRPDALVIGAGSDWRILIEGMDELIKVKRLR